MKPTRRLRPRASWPLGAAGAVGQDVAGLDLRRRSRPSRVWLMHVSWLERLYLRRR